MSNRSRANQQRNNANNDYLRSQSMVPELDKNIANLSIDKPPSPSASSSGASSACSMRSRSAISVPRSPPNLRFANNYQFSTRPDAGGKDGRKTNLLTNFYEIDIDYDKGAYHYDVEIIFSFERKDGSKGETNARKEYKHQIIEKVFKDNKLGLYAFDGEKNLYTVNTIDLSKASGCFQTKIVVDHDEGEQNFIVKLQLASSISLKTMKDYIEGKVSEIPKTAINLLNLVIRQNKLKTHKLERNSVYNLNGEKKDLGSGLCYVIGQYLSIKPCLNGWMQNSDMDTAIFYKSITLDQFVLELFPRANLSAGLNETDAKKFSKEIKGLMIETTHSDNHRKYKILGLNNEPASKETFELTDYAKETKRKITVADYFKETYATLKYPNLPCIRAGNPTKPASFPLEVCKIVDGQRYKKLLNPQQQKTIAKGTVLLPYARANLIDKLMKENVQDQKFLDQFGVKCCNKNIMTQVVARILNSPNVLYKNNKTAMVRNATWRMANNIQLYNSRNLDNWLLIWIAKTNLNTEDREYYRDKLINGITYTFSNGGLRTAKPIFQYLPDKTIPEIFNLIRQNCKSKPQLVMFIMNEGEERDEIKKIAEKDVGLMTQCVKYDKFISQMDGRLAADDIVNDRKLCMYLSNLLLKVNAKIGGTNNLVDFSLLKGVKLNRPQEAVMFFGADVTHQMGDGSSIAAVVASLDLCFTHYSVQLSEQFHEKENKLSKEIINDLSKMASALITSFRNHNKVLPSKIVFYRDGVDEGQFQTVLNKELAALKEACSQLQAGYSPAITFIIVQKRHHIRFFPLKAEDKMGKSENIPAGTVVDTGITALNQFDFFLCSHETIQGTAQPTHYWVIHDENNFSSDDIQNLTFMMCHLYVKSTKAVSIPAPVYYAHLAAFRGRMYKQSDASSDVPSDIASEYQSDVNNNPELETLIHSRLIQIHPSLQETMFFA